MSRAAHRWCTCEWALAPLACVVAESSHSDTSVNSLGGTIPAAMGALTSLQQMYRRRGRFATGLWLTLLQAHVPQRIGWLGAASNRQLERFDGLVSPSCAPVVLTQRARFINDNRLDGTIPSQLAALTGLQYL